MFYIIDDGGEPLDCIYECLDAMDASTVEKRATEILNALGFNKQMQSKNTRLLCWLENVYCFVTRCVY